jgi:hypothetical protein
MTNRLIVDNSRLCISKQGIDVLTSAFKDNLFDSRNYKYIASYAKGVLLVSNFQTVGQSAIFGGIGYLVKQYVVNYGKVFSSPPIVLAMFKGGYWSGVTPWFNQYTDKYINGRYYNTSIDVGYKSFTDRVIFEIYYHNYSLNSAGPTEIAYYVAQSG